jgi:DNA-binding transcriptional MocR family regulator
MNTHQSRQTLKSDSNNDALQTDHQLPSKRAVSEPLGVYTNRDNSSVLK